MEYPTYPIKVTFLEDEDDDEFVWILDNENELVCNLEWFDSRDPEEHAIVEDKFLRRIRVKIEEFRLIEFFIEDQDKY